MITANDREILPRLLKLFSFMIIFVVFIYIVTGLLGLIKHEQKIDYFNEGKPNTIQII